MKIRIRSELLAVALFCLFIQGCADLQIQWPAFLSPSAKPPEDTRACVQHFAVEGNYLLGRQFRSFAEYPQSNLGAIYDDLLSAVTAGGYLITSADREAGFLSASKGRAPIGADSDHSNVLNISIQRMLSAGTRVDVLFGVPGGLVPTNSEAQTEFCRLLGAVVDHPAVPVAAATALPQPAPVMRRPGVLEPTAAQRRRIHDAIFKRTGTTALDSVIKEASAVITQVIELHGCWNFAPGENTLANYPLRAFEASGVSTWSKGALSRPMSLDHHPKNTCVSVNRIVGWSASVKSALSFEVVYMSDSSGEVRRIRYDLVRTPGSGWLLQDIEER